MGAFILGIVQIVLAVATTIAWLTAFETNNMAVGFIAFALMWIMVVLSWVSGVVLVVKHVIR
jgi:hypothetical protein